MLLHRFTLTLPVSRRRFASQLLDSREIPFEDVLDAAAACVLRFFARDEGERDAWLELLRANDLARYACVEPWEYDPNAWVDAWRQYYEWVRISPRLAVGPDFKPCPWELDTTVRITPGQAFGTGVHESTRLSLTLIDRYLQPGHSVLDAGCGTGVLAVAAARLGAGPVIGFDIDPDAARESRHNARLNRVAPHFVLGGIEAIAGEFDLVVANMLAVRLLAIAPALRAAVRPGGVLILAGLVDKDRGTFEAPFFDGAPFSRLADESLNDWWAAAWRRAPA